MDLVISDTNILIDVENGNLTSVIFRLPYEIAVPDVLFESELRERHSHLIEAGLKIKSLSAEFIKRAHHLSTKHPRPGTIDRIALALALQENCPLLTGDRDLRAAAINEGVRVYGTLWVVGELLKTKLLEPQQARNSFDSMKRKGSRLPWGDVENLLMK